MPRSLDTLSLKAGMASAAAGPPQPELVDCTVSAEWATAVTGVSTGHLQGELARPDLWQEFLLLEKLLYKNANQHRGAQHFQRLQEVRLLLGLLKAMQLDRRVGALHDALQAGKQRGAPLRSATTYSSLPLACGTDQRRLPSHQAAVWVLRSLQAGCRLVEQLAGAVQRASLQLLAQLGHSFFMPLCLTSLAVLARVQVLTGQLMLDAVKAYNVLAEAAVLLPASPEASAASAAAGEGEGDTAAGAAAAATAAAAGSAAPDHGQQLPQMLRAKWRSGLPALECIPWPHGESFEAQAAAACSRYAVQLVQPDSQQAKAAAAMRRGGKQGLAVVEDRGVRISREAFAASAAAAASAGAAAAAPSPAAAAAVAAAAAAAAEPVLLGVVEDSLLGEDACGDVSSLMDGEARGHLYRRSTRGLAHLEPLTRQQEAQPASLASGGAAAAAGGQAAAVAAPAAAQQQREQPAAAQARAAQPSQQRSAVSAAQPARPAPLPVSAAPARPAFTLVPAPAPAAKPAFLSVAVPAAKPAFLSVAAPAPAPAAAGAAATPEPALPACLGISGPAVKPAAAPGVPPPRALDVTAGRQRKKPAVAVAAQQQLSSAAAAPEAPKSWEDWLQPMGGAAGASTAPQPAAPPAAKQSQGKQPQGKRRR